MGGHLLDVCFELLSGAVDLLCRIQRARYLLYLRKSLRPDYNRMSTNDVNIDTDITVNYRELLRSSVVGNAENWCRTAGI